MNSNYCQGLSSNELARPHRGVEIFPNPASEKIILEYEVERIEMLDINGRRIKNLMKVSSIDISDLSEEIYFLRIKTSKGEFNKKLIKE